MHISLSDWLNATHDHWPKKVNYVTKRAMTDQLKSPIYKKLGHIIKNEAYLAKLYDQLAYFFCWILKESGKAS